MGRKSRTSEPRRPLRAFVPDLVQPWVEAGAQRVTDQLARFGPDRRAAELDTRLDGVRARFEVVAESARPPRGERDRLTAELDAVRTELDRLAPRLSPVRAQILAARVEAYRQALAAWPEPRARATRPGQDAGVMAGTAALGWAFLQAAPTAAMSTGAGLVAAGGVATVMTVRKRIRRRDRRAALSQALDAAEATLPTLGDRPVDQLSRALHELVRRARSSGRLSTGAGALLVRIAERLDGLLARSLVEQLDQDVVHLVRASITDYLPDTLEPFLALPDAEVTIGDRTAGEEVTDQLAALDRALAAAADRTGRDRAADQLLVQGEFLRTMFGG